MGWSIEPVRDCESWGPVSMPGFYTPEDCEAACTCANYWSIISEGDCITGSGTCYYRCVGTACVEEHPGNWWCYGFWSLVESTCHQIGSDETQHEYDVPRTLAFDYNLCSIPGNKYESYPCEDGKTVFGLRNVEASMNIAVKVDLEHWIP